MQELRIVRGSAVSRTWGCSEWWWATVCAVDRKSDGRATAMEQLKLGDTEDRAAAQSPGKTDRGLSARGESPESRSPGSGKAEVERQREEGGGRGKKAEADGGGKACRGWRLESDSW